MYYHMIILTLFVSFITASEESILLSVTYEKAKEFCQNHALVSVHNASQNEHLRTEMTSANLSSVWLPIKRTSLNNWRWMNQSENEDFEEKTNHSCAVFDQNSGQIHPAACSSRSYGHICEVQGCPKCKSLGWDSVVCQHLQDTCYVYFCDYENWHGARLSCERKDWRLAVASTQAIRSTLSQGQYACHVHWVGLSKEEFIYEEGGRLEYENWGPDQPSDEGDCVCMQANGTWKVSSCTEQRNAICSGTTSPGTTVPNQTTRWWIILIVAICLALAVIFIFLAYRFLWKTSSGNNNNRENGVAGGVHREDGRRAAESLHTKTMESQGTSNGTEEGRQEFGRLMEDWRENDALSPVPVSPDRK